MRHRPRLAIVALSSIALATSGCATNARVWTGDTATAAVLPQVSRSDRVLLLMRDGAAYNCPIQRYDTEFVFGCRDPVALADIEEVRFRKRDGKPALTLPDLKLGDLLMVHTRSGGVRQLRFTGMGPGSLRGEEGEVALSEVTLIELRRAPLTPAARNVLGTLTAAALVVAAVTVYAFAKAREGEEE